MNHLILAAVTAEGTQAVGVFLMLLAFYLFPTIVAGLRRHHNDGAIFVTNLFLGWTIIGWIIALIWAATNPSPVKAK